MKKINLLIWMFMLLIFTLLYGCDSNNNPVFDELDKISQISDINPDSAYIFLSQINLDNFTTDLEYRYKLLNIKIKARCNEDITADTIEIDKIKKYFLTGKNDSLICVSYYYSGVIYNENKKNVKAVEDLLYAHKHSNNYNSIKSKIQQNIANTYSRSGLIEEAIEWYKEAYNSYYLNNNLKWASNCLTGIGNSFQMIKNYDSAMFYYEKAIELKKEINETINIGLQLNMIFAYCRLKDYETVKKMALPILDNININTDERKLLIYLDLADAYFYTGMIDSATFYMQKTKDLEIQDNANLMSTFFLWYLIEKEKNNYSDALNYYETYIDYEKESILEENTLIIKELSEKYQNEALKNEVNKQKNKRQRTVIFAIIISIILLLIILGIFYLLKKTRAEKSNVENKLQEVSEAKQNVEYNLDKLKDFVQSQGETTYKSFLYHFDFLKKVIDLANIGDKEKRGEKAKEIINDLSSEIIFNTVNGIDKKYHKEFIQKYPKLDEKEIVICYMILFGFSKFEISKVLNHELNTIQQKKTNIRQKIGAEAGSDIKEFISQDFRKLDYEIKH